eukprot:SM000177S03167  [mRNA]  locus=s177:13531:14817:+ [translate_table: standard]
MKQTVSNACGTVGLLHALGNATAAGRGVQYADGSWLHQFFQETAALSPDERGKLLEVDERMESAHASAASVGSTAPPDISEPVDLHFICFATVDGEDPRTLAPVTCQLLKSNAGALYELDGSKPFVVNRGPSSPDTTLEDAAKIIKQYVEHNSASLSFNVIAVSAAA